MGRIMGEEKPKLYSYALCTKRLDYRQQIDQELKAIQSRDRLSSAYVAQLRSRCVMATTLTDLRLLLKEVTGIHVTVLGVSSPVGGVDNVSHVAVRVEGGCSASSCRVRDPSPSVIHVSGSAPAARQRAPPLTSLHVGALCSCVRERPRSRSDQLADDYLEHVAVPKLL